MNTFIMQKSQGGLGNQLFIVFNLIALSKKFNKNILIEYENDNNSNRKNIKEYHFFSNNLLLVEKIEIKDYLIIRELNYKYKSISLLSNKNYLLKGYFQSYKYFWDYKDEIKKIINIDQNCLSRIDLFLKDRKKIIAIHVRLGDYLLKSHYHFNLPIDYYKTVLNKINDIQNYEIFLFSDDVDLAQKMFNDLTYSIADCFSLDDEEQLLFMSHCDIIIGCNSTYSLMASYLNEIYNFNLNSKYYYPDVWFTNDSIDFDINSIIPDSVNYHIIPMKHYLVNNDILFFYTIFYKIRHKIPFYEYMDLFYIMINKLYNYKLVVFTNQETFQLIEDYKVKYPNLIFIIIEFDDFDFFEYKDVFEQNIKNLKFITSFHYLLLNINRHLLIKNFKDYINYKFYSYIDVECFQINQNIDPWIFKFNNENYSFIFNKKDQYYNTSSYLISTLKFQIFENIYIKIFKDDIDMDDKTILTKIFNSNFYDDKILIVNNFIPIVEFLC